MGRPRSFSWILAALVIVVMSIGLYVSSEEMEEVSARSYRNGQEAGIGRADDFNGLEDGHYLVVGVITGEVPGRRGCAAVSRYAHTMNDGKDIRFACGIPEAKLVVGAWFGKGGWKDRPVPIVLP